MEIPGVKQIKHASSKAGLKLFLLALIATGALYFQLLYVEQYDFSKDFDREKVLNKIKETASRKVLVETSALTMMNKQTIQGVLRNISSLGNTVFMESLDIMAQPCNHNCPARIKFEYDKFKDKQVDIKIDKSDKYGL